ncbi:hypothetical protein LY78DRAFT_375550 [Colletotrichum sublineola]|nr:hypothetical protein LY78DRAFT_375550 [Colletotrichum sublineola]
MGERPCATRRRATHTHTHTHNHACSRDSSHGDEPGNSPPLVLVLRRPGPVSRKGQLDGPVSTAQPSLEHPWTSWSRGQDRSSGFQNAGTARHQHLPSSQAHDHSLSFLVSGPGAFSDLGVFEVSILRRICDWLEPEISTTQEVVRWHGW